MPTPKTRRHSRPSFPVFLRAELGAVEMSGSGTEPPDVVAFRLVSEHAASNIDRGGEPLHYEWTLPGGPQFTIEVSHER